MEDVSQVPAAASSAEKAGFWIRVIAYIIDGIILGIVNEILSVTVGRASSGLANLIGLVISLLYFSYLWSGASPLGAVTGADDGIGVNLTKSQVQELPPVDIDHPAG